MSWAEHTTGEPQRAAIVDRHPPFLGLLTRLLQDHYADVLTVIGAFPDSIDLLRDAGAPPHVILLGLSAGCQSALAVIPQMRARFPATSILVLGALDLDGYAQAALAAGADAFIPKGEINTALRAVLMDNVQRGRAIAGVQRAVVPGPTRCQSGHADPFP